jgi:hypothetical protein
VLSQSAAHHAEERWFYQRMWDVLSSRESLSAWLYRALPDTFGEVWTLTLAALMWV